MKRCQIDLWPAQCHATAVSIIEHPIRQLTAKVRPLLRVDTSQILAAPKGRYLERATEQRMRTICNPRKPQTVCRMSRVGHTTFKFACCNSLLSPVTVASPQGGPTMSMEIQKI